MFQKCRCPIIWRNARKQKLILTWKLFSFQRSNCAESCAKLHVIASNLELQGNRSICCIAKSRVFFRFWHKFYSTSKSMKITLFLIRILFERISFFQNIWAKYDSTLVTSIYFWLAFIYNQRKSRSKSCVNQVEKGNLLGWSILGKSDQNSISGWTYTSTNGLSTSTKQTILILQTKTRISTKSTQTKFRFSYHLCRERENSITTLASLEWSFWFLFRARYIRYIAWLVLPLTACKFLKQIVSSSIIN